MFEAIFSIGSVVAALFLILFGMNAASEYQCKSIAAEMAVNYKFKFSTGCMIEYKVGKYVPLKSVRGVD